MRNEEKTITTNIGAVPIGDYLEICALQYGFDSYADMRAEGYHIYLPTESPDNSGEN